MAQPDSMQFGDTPRLFEQSYALPNTPSQLSFDIRTKPEKWAEDPAFVLKQHGRLLGLQKQKEQIDQDRYLDEMGLKLAGDDQIDLIKHQTELGKTLGQIQSALMQAAPAHHAASISQTQQLGTLVAGLLGGGAAFSGALGGAQLNANNEEARRYANAVNQDQATRQGLEMQYQQANTDLNRTNNQIDQNKAYIRRREDEITDNNATIKDEEEKRAAQWAHELELKKLDIELKSQGITTKENEGIDKGTKDVWNKLSDQYAKIGGVTLQSAKEANSKVDEINKIRKEKGLFPLPYLPVGSTVAEQEYQHKINQDRIKQNNWLTSFKNKRETEAARLKIAAERNSLAAERIGFSKSDHHYAETLGHRAQEARALADQMKSDMTSEDQEDPQSPAYKRWQAAETKAKSLEGLAEKAAQDAKQTDAQLNIPQAYVEDRKDKAAKKKKALSALNNGEISQAQYQELMKKL